MKITQKTKNIIEKITEEVINEYLGGMMGVPNINSECEKCGMPSNACECQLEDDKKNNGKAELPKGLKFQTDNSTNMTIKKGLKESVVDVVRYKDYIIKIHKMKSSYMASVDQYWTASSLDKNKVIATVKKAIDDKTIPMKEASTSYEDKIIATANQLFNKKFSELSPEQMKRVEKEVGSRTPSINYLPKNWKEFHETSPNSVKRDILQKIPGSKKTIKIR